MIFWLNKNISPPSYVPQTPILSRGMGFGTQKKSADYDLSDCVETAKPGRRSHDLLNMGDALFRGLIHIFSA